MKLSLKLRKRQIIMENPLLLNIRGSVQEVFEKIAQLTFDQIKSYSILRKLNHPQRLLNRIGFPQHNAGVHIVFPKNKMETALAVELKSKSTGHLSEILKELGIDYLED